MNTNTRVEKSVKDLIGEAHARGGLAAVNRAIQARQLKKVSADDIHTLLNTLEELSEDQALPKSLKKPVNDLMEAIESLSVGDLKALADGDAGGSANTSTFTEDDEPAGAGSGSTEADKVAGCRDLMKRARSKPIPVRLGERF